MSNPLVARFISTLSRVPTIAYVVVIIVSFLGSWLALNNKHQRDLGALNAQISAQESENRTLRMAQDSLAGVYRVDTLRLTKIKRVTDSLTTTVEVWKRDTLKVVEYVEKADSSIRVCTQALQTCEARVLNAQQGWANARAEIAKIKATIPSKGQKWLWMLGGAAGGAVIGYVAHP